MDNSKLIESTLELAAKSLPEDFELYDFGGGWTVAPVPDGGNNFEKQYISDHMAAVSRVRNVPSDPSVVTGFSFDLKFVTARQLVEGMERAVEANRTQKVPFAVLTQETQ